MEKITGKNRIINTVLRELKEGNNSFTVREIAEKANVSVGLLYYHYSGVDALYTEVHGLYIKKIRELLHSIKDASKPLCYELTHQLFHLELHRNHPKLGTVFINCLDEYNSYTKKTLVNIFNSFTIELTSTELEYETLLYVAMIKEINKLAIKDKSIKLSVLIQMVLSKVLSPYSIDKEELEPCLQRALKTIEKAKEDGMFFPTIPDQGN